MSGGLDSSTLLYKLKLGSFIECMFFDYGQTHIKERLAAREICNGLKVKLHECKLPSVFTDSCLVGSKPIPSGNSADNIVPNRNMVMLSAATAYAIQHDFDAVAIGCNNDDAKNGFPDCSKPFLSAMRDSMRFCHTKPIQLLTPFIEFSMGKKEVIKLAEKLNVPLEKTWSCYKGDKEPCGECGACKAIELAK